GIFTMDRLRTMVVQRDGRVKEKREKEEEIERMVSKANDEGTPIVIRYRDGRGKRTSRMIDPLEITKDSYTGGYRIKAHCYLRDDERTFLLDRIVDAIPPNLDLTVVG
ncbi:MAG: WYL domain-containing protein, partial [Candidatus Hydrothermarchaeales archaeon]